jgi:hypothetical protein
MSENVGRREREVVLTLSALTTDADADAACAQEKIWVVTHLNLNCKLADSCMGVAAGEGLKVVVHSLVLHLIKCVETPVIFLAMKQAKAS